MFVSGCIVRLFLPFESSQPRYNLETAANDLDQMQEAAVNWQLRSTAGGRNVTLMK